MRATFDRSQVSAKNIRTFWFEPEKPVRYVAGQYTQIRLPHENMDSRGDKRWFTLSSSPSEKSVSITTRLDPERPSTFKKTLFKLEPGAEVNLADAMGDFVLPKQKDIPLVFVAGGLGITPMHSMIKWLEDTGEKREISLYYASHTLEEIAFREFFENASVDFKMILNEPPEHWQGLSGRLTSDVIYNLPGVKDKSLVYISGPEPMVQAFHKELNRNGIPEHRLVVDEFPGYTEANV
jgi:ferredoxin-NADP reductase